MPNRKIVEIELDEIEELLQRCAQARKLISAIQNGLSAMDKWWHKVEQWLSVMEFRVTYAKEVEDDED